VPSGVEVCRCGTAHDAAAPDRPAQTSTSRGLNPAIVWLGTLVLVAAGGAWLWSTVALPSESSAPSGPTVTAALAEPRPATAPAARPPTVEVAPTSESMAAESAPASTPSLPPHGGNAGAAESIGLEDLVARTSGAVVMVEAGSSRGTGFFVRPDLIVTNDHVIAGASTVTVRLHDGSARSARVERTVADVDLALLRTSTPSATVLPLGQVAAVRTGQEVIAIGSALGLQNTVTRGIVSARRQAGSIVLLQTDAAINPGNSGGPLLDRQGVVVGVTTLKMGGQAEGLGFAVAADHVAALVEGRSSALVATAAGPAAAPPPGAAASGNALPGFGADASSADARRVQGEQAFERDIAALAQQAAQVDGYWDRFTSSCAPRPRQSGDRGWFGLANGRVEYTGRDRNCPYWLNDMNSMSREFEAGMRAIGENARRAGVFPGTLRDVRRKYKLDWSGFDR
jgi:S1-C subfamily serine protease